MANTFSELQIWKRQLVKADTQLRNFEASTQQLTGMLDTTLHAYPRVWQHTSLGANDGHLPQEVASLPVPATAPVAHMSAETTQELTARLQAQTHQPLDAWHKRYGELKVAMVPLEASRKHYEQACAELIKAQGYQQKVASKKGSEAAAALDGGIAEKEALRQERWGKYLELEEQTWNKAAQLAADARQAQNFLAAGMQELSAAFSAISQQYAGLGGGVQAAPGPQQPAGAISLAAIAPQTSWVRKSGAASPSPVAAAAAAAAASPASSSPGGSFNSARSAKTFGAAGAAPPGNKGLSGAAQEREWMRLQQEEDARAAAAAGGPKIASAGMPIAAGPAIAAVDLSLQQQAGAPTPPGAASATSTPGVASPKPASAWQPPVPVQRYNNEQSLGASPSQEPQLPQQQPQQQRYGEYQSPGATPSQDWSPLQRHGPSKSAGTAPGMSQGHLPPGAYTVRQDSAPSPDGPSSGYTRPSKLPARLPTRESSYTRDAGPGLPRASANGEGGNGRTKTAGDHSRGHSETSEASVIEHPTSPTSVASSSEADGSRRYLPSYLRESAGPKTF